MKTIQDKWPIHSGRIRVRVIGERGELPDDLHAIVEATDQDGCIEGSVLGRPLQAKVWSEGEWL